MKNKHRFLTPVLCILLGSASAVYSSTITVTNGALQVALDSAQIDDIIQCDITNQIVTSTGFVVDKRITLLGLNAKLADGAGNTSILTVTADQVRIADIDLDGNRATIDLNDRQSLILMHGNDFIIEDSIFRECKQNGIGVTPLNNDVNGGIVRNITGYEVDRDVVSIEGDGGVNLYVRNISVSNVAAYASEKRGAVEVSDGTYNITVDGVYAEDAVYGVDFQDHNHVNEANIGTIIKNVSVIRCDHAIRSNTDPRGHANLVIQNISGSDFVRKQEPLEIHNTDGVSVDGVQFSGLTSVGRLIDVEDSQDVVLANVSDGAYFYGQSSIEACSENLGAVTNGLTAPYELDNLYIGTAGSVVQVRDNQDNSSGAGSEVLYVDTLQVNSGCTLDLNGLIIYYNTLNNSGTVRANGGGLIHIGSPILLPPAAPAGLTIATNAASFDLAWDANGEPDFASYSVYHSTVSGVFGVPLEVGMTTNVLNTGAPKVGVTYYYVVTASDAAGNESAVSAEVAGQVVDPTGESLVFVTFKTGEVYGFNSIASNALNVVDQGSATDGILLATVSAYGDYQAFAIAPDKKVYGVNGAGDVLEWQAITSWLAGEASASTLSAGNYNPDLNKKIHGVSYDPATEGYYAVLESPDVDGDVVQFDDLAAFVANNPSVTNAAAYNGNLANFYYGYDDVPDTFAGRTNLTGVSYFSIAGTGHLEGYQSLEDYIAFGTQTFQQNGFAPKVAGIFAMIPGISAIGDVAFAPLGAAEYELSWDAESSGSYAVQFDEDLVFEPGWSNVITDIEGINGILSVTTAVDSAQGFFRVIAE
jgi:hypothetical protein